MTSTSPAQLAPVNASASTLRARLAALASDIKIHHTVFAMPWALLSAVLAGRWYPGTLTPAATALGKMALIILCMVAARTVAMAANRLLDAELDARNPRTASRAIPAGTLSRRFVGGIVILCCAVFIAGAAMFQVLYHNPWPLALSIPVLIFLACYPLLKRFTRLCHYYLGVALALAPVCAWVAVAGRIDWPPIVMFTAVMSWTAGFDIIYACQDFQSDIDCGVFSVPAKIGIPAALWVSRFTHAFCAAMLIVLAKTVPQFGVLFAIGVGLAISLLIVEQTLVKPTDLSKINLAFFTVNGVMSVTLGTLGIIDLLR